MWSDSHCHIHSDGYKLDVEQEIKAAKDAGVKAIILVGEDVSDSKRAIELASKYDGCWATVGIHPHEAKKAGDIEELVSLSELNKVVGIGECGIDYYYEHSSRDRQKSVLEFQLKLAHRKDLPLSIHIRSSKQDSDDAFVDFFEIFDQISNDKKSLKGVVHSFSSNAKHMHEIIKRDLLFGVNGIVTFASKEQQDVINQIPLERLILETDAPYLTPLPQRGKVNRPKNVVITGEFISKQRGIEATELASVTSSNVSKLFKMEV